MRFGVLVALLACVACSHSRPNYYKRSVTEQEKCCGKLKDDAAQAQCLKDIPRLDLANVPEEQREEAETSQINQETFRCVDENFECDAKTGHATAESAQNQLDCVNSLETAAAQ